MISKAILSAMTDMMHLLKGINKHLAKTVECAYNEKVKES